MKRKLLFLLLSSTILLSCKVTFVPDFDDSISQQIMETAKANDKLYLELLAAPIDKRSYSDFEKEYIQIEAEINSIYLKNEIRKKNEDMIAIIEILHKHFKQYREEHQKLSRPLKDAEIIDYENYIHAFWKTLLFAENGLPHPTPDH